MRRLDGFSVSAISSSLAWRSTTTSRRTACCLLQQALQFNAGGAVIWKSQRGVTSRITAYLELGPLYNSNNDLLKTTARAAPSRRCRSGLDLLEPMLVSGDSVSSSRPASWISTSAGRLNDRRGKRAKVSDAQFISAWPLRVRMDAVIWCGPACSGRIHVRTQRQAGHRVVQRKAEQLASSRAGGRKRTAHGSSS